MKVHGAFVVAGLLAGSLFVAGRAVSQDAGGEVPKEAPKEAEKRGFRGADPREYSQAEQMKGWMEACTPNQFHERLGKRVGEWDIEFTMIPGPGMPPMVTRGTAKISWLFQGRWLKEEFKSTLMGMPFEGFSLMGYSNFKKKYVGTWVDSMSTSLLSFEGNPGKDGKTLFLSGAMDEPMTGEHDKLCRMITREVGDDEFVFEMHDMSIGEADTKVFWIKYTRKKQ